MRINYNYHLFNVVLRLLNGYIMKQLLTIPTIVIASILIHRARKKTKRTAPIVSKT